MNEELELKSTIDLATIKSYLDTDEDFCQLVEVTNLSSVPVLLVPFELGSESIKSQYVISFIPIDRDIIEFNSLIQFYFVFPIELASKNTHALRELIDKINLTLPIGNFGINNKSEIYFRYVSMQPATEDLNENRILDTTMLIEYNIELYFGALGSVNGGSKSVEEVISEINI